MPTRVLIKTTIPTIEDDWHIERFSLLVQHLKSLTDATGAPLYAVTSADRVETQAGDDADLAAAGEGAFDQVWLLAVDVTNALSEGDVAHLQRLRARGGGLFVTRDHQDLGACLARLGAVGRTQHFQTINPEADVARHICDDTETPTITWPNYHSGRNGDLQDVEAVAPLHPVMRAADGGPIRQMPAHPHEGAVSAPDDLAGIARVIARGRSKLTGAPFNLAVAIEEPGQGRAISDASFHHLADYNWDPRLGCPSFVTEPEGDGVLRTPNALAGVHAYVTNAAAWLAGSQ